MLNQLICVKTKFIVILVHFQMFKLISSVLMITFTLFSPLLCILMSFLAS